MTSPQPTISSTDSTSGADRAFIARQPIMDCKGQIFAYELLFRSANSHKMEILDDMSATSQVILNTINSIGINKVLGGKLGFVNMSETFFEEGIFESLDKERFVLEILEHTKVSPSLVSKLETMAKEGYTLALDDFIFEEDMLEVFRPVLSHIKILKIDLMGTDLKALESRLSIFKQYDFELLAEKVESREDFELCKKLGFSYFQGYFFSKPEIMEGKKVDPNVMAVMELARLARQTESPKALEAAFKRHPDITVNFLRFVNSAGMAFRSKITSVRHGLNLVGQQKLLRWLMLMVYAKSGIHGDSSPLLATASVRAAMMEQSLYALGKRDDDTLNQGYLVGILSLMDVVFQVEMDQLLKDLDIDAEISRAITHAEGPLGRLLKLVVACERQEFDKAIGILEEVGLESEKLAEILFGSYREADLEL